MMTTLQPDGSMPLTSNVTYTIFNEGISDGGSGVSSYGAYTVNWSDPPIEMPESIAPGATATLEVATPIDPDVQITLWNLGTTLLQVAAPGD